jgi:hypothetical protein
VKRSKAERKLRKYLQAAPFTMWGDYEIAKPYRLEDAVQWCMKHLQAAGVVSADKEPQGEPSQWNIGQPLDFNVKHPVEPKKRILPEFDPAWLEAPLTERYVDPLYAKCNDLNCKEGLDEHSHPVEPESEKPVQFDSGFVIYKDALQCTCEDGEGYFIVALDCPIHSTHAFPWRKSR